MVAIIEVMFVLSMVAGHLIVVANKVAIRRGFEGNSYQITINEDLKSGKVKSIHIISKNSKGILWPIMPNSRL